MAGKVPGADLSLQNRFASMIAMPMAALASFSAAAVAHQAAAAAQNAGRSATPVCLYP
ncbi:hypothetical protein ACNJYA_10495 [Bradyrhizobium sp. DASA03068]|uniref:hypothetical protein n=1 Tax=Bradyrhizobium sp. BLXBL-01 TaxID=3395915 RepID=UPI003F6FFD9B